MAKLRLILENARQQKITMTMRLTLLVATVVAIVVVAKGEKIYGVDELVGLGDEAEIKSWDAYLAELNQVLRDKLDKQHPELRDDPEGILEMAANELGTGYTRKCLRAKKSQKAAFRSFLALRDTLAGECDDNDTYEILAKNHLAHQALLEWAQFREEYSDVIGKVLHHYQLKHAQKCRPILKQKFEQEFAEIPSETKYKLKVAFEDLNLYDFGFSGMAPGIFKNLVAVYRPSFTRPISREALKKIAKNVQSIQALPTIKPTAGDLLMSYFQPGKRYGVEHIKPMLDEHLLKPCKRYRRKLATILNEARLDAVVEDGQAQEEFIHGDGDFYQALINNRLCGSLLEAREELHKPLVEAWNDALTR